MNGSTAWVLLERTRRGAPGWISVQETLPEPGEKAICLDLSGALHWAVYTPGLAAFHWDCQDCQDCQDYGLRDSTITPWLRIPPAPSPERPSPKRPSPKRPSPTR